MRLGLHIITPEPVSTVYFINLSIPPINLCVCVYSPIVTKKRLGNTVTAATSTHAKTEESFDASFSMRSVWYQKNTEISEIAKIRKSQLTIMCTSLDYLCMSDLRFLQRRQEFYLLRCNTM
jgi:hypothetical protein